jgi:hypothetical protein
VKQAILVLQELIPQAPTLPAKVSLQRDLLEACATGGDWSCVQRGVAEMLPIVSRTRATPVIEPADAARANDIS